MSLEIRIEDAKWRKMPRTFLPRLKRAVAAEDYEAAARLRDQIKGIEQEHGR